MSNKTVLITGASRGIGRAIALYFIEKNYNTVLICKGDISRMNDLVEKANCNNLSCICYKADVSLSSNIEEIFADLDSKNISIDILINNAGISYVGLLQDMSYEEWNNSIATNLSSAFFTSKKVIPHMLSKGEGKILNISSVWGVCGASMEVAYSTTKGGINAFTKALAKELAPSNIQVNAIACGAVDTEMNNHLDKEEKEVLINEIPAGRMATPYDVASFVYGIVTSNNYLTGQIINFDGGWI